MKTEYGENKKLQHLIDEYHYADTKIKEMKKYQDDVKDAIIAGFSKVDPTSDFEGTENIETDTDAIALTWKISKSFDEPNLKYICAAHNVPLEQVANVKYNYSSTLMHKLPADIKTELELNALTTKRAATGFKITTFKEKETK